MSRLARHATLVDAFAGLARDQGAADPRVRGGDWRQAIVATVGPGGLVTTTDGITARRLESYRAPAAGDRIIIAVSSAGSWVAAGRLATDTDGRWIAYTPTWTADGTAPSVGNGTLIGRYSRIGRTVTVHINLRCGSSTSAGSGNYWFALPVQAASSGCTYVGDAHIIGGSRWGGQFVISPAATKAAPFFPTSSTDPRLTWMSPTQPEIWANGSDELRITATYEAAN